MQPATKQSRAIVLVLKVLMPKNGLKGLMRNQEETELN